MNANNRKILEDAGVLYPVLITNADRIRAMTDEQLADWLASYVLHLDGAMRDISYQAWYNWLKQECRGKDE